MFQLTAARRRLGDFVTRHPPRGKVSTHSRPKAAGEGLGNPALVAAMFQLTAARRRLAAGKLAHIKPTIVSTHSRPKAAGAYRAAYNAERMFQLTAARRRLGVTL